MGVRETHFKRRLAYSTISNLSYILLGVTMMSPLGLVAGLSHLLVHAIMKISAFFCAGAVMHQTEKNYVYELDGLGYEMPVTFTALFVSGLSLTGIPLLAGFVSKWNIVQALLEHKSAIGYTGVVVLLYSALMTGIYMLTIIVRAWFPHVGYHKDQVEEFKDPNWLMKLPLILFTAATLVIGFYAQPILDFIQKIASGAL
jgi:multicomponent Na+:H+ antiporter subunit D